MVTTTRQSATWRRFPLVLLALLAPWTASAWAATTWHVAPGGSDAHPGTQTQPLGTVAAAIQRAAARDTVLLKAGTYDLGGQPLTAEKPLSLVGEDRRTTVLTRGTSLSFTKSLTVKNLTFRAGPALCPAPPEGQALDGISIEHCTFEDFWAGLHARNFKGPIVNVNISNCEFSNLSGGKVVAIGIFQGPVSKIRITGNSFRNLKSTTKGSSAVVIGDLKTTKDVLIAENHMDTIEGPAVAGSAGPEVHGVLAFGTDIRILKNTVRNLNAGIDHEAIYMKARDSMIADNVVENCGSGPGGADICSKGGDFSENNVYRGNRITSDLPGCGIFVAGGAVVQDNYVKKTNGWNGIDVYALGKPVTITGNYSETCRGAAIHVSGGDHRGNPFEWPNPGEIVVTNNEAISYQRSPIKIANAQKARASDNRERKGR